MSNYRVRQVLALKGIPERQLRFLLALATWMDDDSRTVKASVDAVFEQTGTARNTARTARRELEKAGRLSSTAGIGRGHLTLWTVHCLPGKGVSDVDPLPCESKRVNDSDPLSDGELKGVSDVDPLLEEKGVKPTAERGSIGPEKGGQPESADLHKRDRGLNRRANPSPLPPERAQLAALVTDVQQGRGSREQERTPASEQQLADEILEIRPLWRPAQVRDVITDPVNQARPWPLVWRAALDMARDPKTMHPKRLLQERYWRSLAPTASRPSRRAWCQDPRCDEDKRWHDWHGDHPHPCPVCSDSPKAAVRSRCPACTASELARSA